MIKDALFLSNFFKGYGQRVQFSVFECFLNLGEMRQLFEKSKKIVKPSEDDVRFYWISEDAVSRLLIIGSEHSFALPKLLCHLGFRLITEKKVT